MLQLLTILLLVFSYSLPVFSVHEHCFPTSSVITRKLKCSMKVFCRKYDHNRRKLRIWSHFVGNKAKGQISERRLQENKASQVLRQISYPLIFIRTCAYQGVENMSFSENLACFVFL